MPSKGGRSTSAASPVIGASVVTGPGVARSREQWDAAYDGSRTATVPDDLQAALDGNEKARAFFATLNGANRYAVLYRIQDAKRPETRARRIEQIVAMLNEGKTFH